MKKLLFIIVSIILAFTVNAQTITLQTSNNGIRKANDQFTGFQATFSYDRIESVTIANTERGTFSALTIAGAYQAVGMYGNPELPEFRKMIQIPVGAVPTVKVNNFTTTEINLGEYGIHPVFPIQPSVRKDQTEIPFVYDEKAYGIDDYNNSTMAEVEILGTMRGIILGMVTVRPVQYNPVSHSILAFNNIDIEVTFDNADRKKTEELFVNTFSPYFLKPYDIVFNSGVTRDVYDDHPDLYSTPVRMLVIANRMFEATLQPWIEWKTKKGFYMDVNYTDEIGTTAAAIKTFCHNKYNQGIANGTAPTFVIFVGDTPQVPASQTGSYTSKATDLYYARVNSSGFFPDMYYSRMSAQNPQALANQIEKILYYEKYEFADPTYLDNALLIAGYHDNSTWDVWIGRPTINYANNYYFNEAHGYANIYKYVTTNYSGCYANLNNVGFANYTAHCGETEWSNPNLSISQVNSLTNLNKYFVAMGNCCLAADFGYTGNGGICMGEAMMIAEKKGAVGYIGSSPSSYWGEDFHFGVGAYSGNIQTVTNPTLENTKTGVYDFMFRDADFNTLCSYVFGGNLSVQYAHNNPGYTTHISAPYYWEAYNVLGDGSLMPYNAQASVNQVSHLPVLHIGVGEYEVSAQPGSYVAISKDGVLHGVAVADAAGLAVVSLNPPINSGGDVDIVVTRNQYQPYITQVPATAPTGPYIVSTGYSVVDEEKLTYISTNTEIEVTLKNVGVASTTGPINATISCDDPQIEFNTSTATCASIAPDGTAIVKFKVTIANDIVDGKNFLTKLFVTDGSKQTWENNLSLKAFAPKFSLAKVLIDGEENGNLPKGSLAKITAVVENKGGADAYSVIGNLEIEDEYIILACSDINNSAQNLPAGESTNLDFYVITNPDMPSGYEAVIELLLSAMYGRSYTAPLKVANSGSSNYCIPPITYGCNSNDKFTSVKLTKISDGANLINHAPTCGSSDGYTDYTNIIVPIEPGAQYKLDVSVGSGGTQYIKGWFDLNGNNIFENNEVLFSGSCSSGGSTSYTFTAPQDFSPGDQRFRLRCKYNSAIEDGCSSCSYGQTLDYTVVFPELYPRVQNVAAVLDGSNITITWEAPAEGTPIGYNIYRNGDILNTELLTTSTFTETDIIQGVYAYNVKAVYAGDKESFAEMSNVICFFLICEKPVNLLVTLDEKTATITWDDSENMEGELLGYNIYGNGTKINLELLDVKEFMDENLAIGTYCYQISSVYDHCEESELTEEFCVTIDPEFCEPPMNVLATNEETSILITWEAPENIDGVLLGYNILRNDIKISEVPIIETEYRDEQPEGGYYQVSAVYEHCESELSEKVGIKDHFASSYSIFPNPTTGNVTIEGKGLNRIEIYDVQGRKLAEYNNINDNLQINVNKYENGIYFVKMYSDNNITVMKRLVIIK